MFNIKILNNISSEGLELLPDDLYKTTTEEDNPDAIILRSFNMHDMKLPGSLKTITRAGAGINNIPLDKCTEKGIVVFNTPGANANAVKELVIASLFLSSRRIDKAINWVQSLDGKNEDVPKLVEKQKSSFEGPEIRGKKLGIIGLGAIGVMVANAAIALEMDVIGYDPFISIDAAWELSSNVSKAKDLEQLISCSDYITIHVPLNDVTQGILDKSKFALMKKGVRIINLARGGLVVNKDLIEAIENGTVARYVTDFPEQELLGNDNIITIPHLGASTAESEQNCSIMAVRQMREFLEKGNIRNSVNFPECELRLTGNQRLIAIHQNIPNMVGQVTTLLADSKINIVDMLNRSKDNIACTIIDIEDSAPNTTVDKIKKVNGMKKVRIIERCS